MLFDNSEIIAYVLYAFIFLLFLWNLIQQLTLFRIKQSQKVFFKGKNAATLEKIVLENQQAWESADRDISDLYEITTKVHELAHLGLHKIGMIRFNPFRDIGGDQSFSIALLDGEKNGLVISSIYSRDGVRVYTKAIQNKNCEKHALTEEEKRAIEIASSEKSTEIQRR